MKIGTRMISRADDEIDLFLVDIRLLAVEPDLRAPLKVLAVTRDHGEATVRCLVMEWLSEFGNMFRPQSGERPRHARFSVSRRETCVAAGANRRVHIATLRIGGRVWQPPFRVNPRRHCTAQYHQGRRNGYAALRKDFQLTPQFFGLASELLASKMSIDGSLVVYRFPSFG
jgi:hypothetical protein